MHAQKHTQSIALPYSGVPLPDSAGLGFSANGRRRINCNHPSRFARKIQEQHYWYFRSIHIFKHTHAFCPLQRVLSFIYFYSTFSTRKLLRARLSGTSTDALHLAIKPIQCSHKCEIITCRSNNCSYCCDNCTLTKVTD